MAHENETIIEIIKAWASGSLASLGAAAIGRLMYHAGEVQKMKRKPFDKNLFWELPVAIGMGMIADGAAAYFNLDRQVSTGLAVGFGYLGPVGVQAFIFRWYEKKPSG